MVFAARAQKPGATDAAEPPLALSYDWKADLSGPAKLAPAPNQLTDGVDDAALVLAGADGVDDVRAAVPAHAARGSTPAVMIPTAAAARVFMSACLLLHGSPGHPGVQLAFARAGFLAGL